MSSKVDWKAGDTAIVRPSWAPKGLELRVLGPAICDNERWWVPVAGTIQPSFFGEDALERKG